MRAPLASPLLMLLIGACKAEPAFETRYDEQSRQMNETAARIEADLNRQLNASQAAGMGGGDNAPDPSGNATSAKP